MSSVEYLSLKSSSSEMKYRCWLFEVMERQTWLSENELKLGAFFASSGLHALVTRGSYQVGGLTRST